MPLKSAYRILCEDQNKSGVIWQKGLKFGDFQPVDFFGKWPISVEIPPFQNEIGPKTANLKQNLLNFKSGDILVKKRRFQAYFNLGNSFGKRQNKPLLKSI